MLLETALGKERFEAMQADPTRFVDAFDGRDMWDYQRDTMRGVLARGEDGKYKHRIAIISWPRQNSKSTLSAWCGLWGLYCAPDCEQIISVGLDRDGARILLNDGRRIIRRSQVLLDQLDEYGLTRTTIRLKDGREWMIRSADAAFSRGYRPALILYDELGWSTDDGKLFEVLSAAQSAQLNPLAIITSTVSPVRAGQLWRLFEAEKAGDPDILLLYENRNLSPRITDEFLEGQRRKLPRTVYLREHENRWSSGTDSFCSSEDYNRAVEGDSPRRESDTGPCVAYLDLGWRKDESALAVGKREDGQTLVVRLEAWKPPEGGTLDLTEVEGRLRDLIDSYNVRKLTIEAPQGVLMGQRLDIPGVHVETIHPTGKHQREVWGALYSALIDGGVKLPKDKVLRRQLLSLSIRQNVSGWRVIDDSKLHQDRALAVAGVCWLAKSGGYQPLPDQPEQPSRWTEKAAREAAPMVTQRDPYLYQRAQSKKRKKSRWVY